MTPMPPENVGSSDPSKKAKKTSDNNKSTNSASISSVSCNDDTVPTEAKQSCQLREQQQKQKQQQQPAASSVENIKNVRVQLAQLTMAPQDRSQTEISNSPLLTVPAMTHFPTSQYGLLGGVVREDPPEPMHANDRLFFNAVAPSSTFICGSQGSGKSNTLSCLLENCLLSSKLGLLPRPLSAIVFHYDTFISDHGGLPCEAAYLASNPKVNVRVLCAPTNYRTIERVYRNIPRVKVQPLQLNDCDLNTQRMNDLMAVSTTEVPLYMHVVNRILREMRIRQQAKNGRFRYSEFRQALKKTGDLTAAQLGPLRQRLDTLESFMAKGSAVNDSGIWKPKRAQLTVVDLSCPCVTADLACSLFNICLSLFLEQSTDIGRVVALDEAHKYMDKSTEGNPLTKNLLGVIRLQRHLGARVFISTQEPTISPKLLDLSSVTIIHRFTSPNWLEMLRSHLAGVAAMEAMVTVDQRRTSQKPDAWTGIDEWGETEESGGGDDDDAGQEENISQYVVPTVSLSPRNPTMHLFSKIVELQTGEAILFAPGAVVGVDIDPTGSTKEVRVRRLGHYGYRVQVRKRLTEDGGKSMVAE